MSSQANQKIIRRNGSPSIKQGPMRATQQFSLVHASTSAGSCRKGSPCSSPATVGAVVDIPGSNRPSSETKVSADRRSPTPTGSVKGERNKPPQAAANSSDLIKRTGSLDTIVGPYLSGQWPRDLAVSQQQQSPALAEDVDLSDKQTQTPEEWDDTDARRKKVLIKQRLQRTKDISKQQAGTGCSGPTSGCSSSIVPPSPQQRQSPGPVQHSGGHAALIALPHSMPIKIPSNHIQKLRIRGSVEGLNQEVEKLIISGTRKDTGLDKGTEGRRAPVAEMLGTSAPRSVDTQTPTAADEGRCSKSSSGAGSRSHSVSPLVSPPDYEGSSPELPFNLKSSWSPKPNNVFLREPPDGCEKVKIGDESRSDSPTSGRQPILIFPMISSGELKLSEGSAFYPLRPIKILQQNVVSNSPSFLEEAT